MSNLPHPLGSSVAGQLFYPGSPDVTAYDIPGAAGSRAVEFGEDGTSAATNRLGYALAKNDEYMQARLEKPIAAVKYVNWIPSSGSGASKQFTGVNLFVGDATYLPETQDVRDSLVCVLDVNYNELVDGSGNRVVVNSLKNSAETASIVGDQPSGGGDGNGFYPSGAVIRFKTVNPVDGYDVLPTYVIPDGTSVVLVYGIAGTLDSLATSGLETEMRDALVRGMIRSSSHIPAAAFLRDGSRPMLGNLDMNSHQVRDCQSLHGTGGTPLEIANTVGAGERILFSDMNVNYVPFANAGCTLPHSPGGFWPSMLGVTNSGARLNEKLHGNRVIDKGGVIDWQDGYMNLPAMVVALNGEAVDVPAQRFPLVGLVTAGSNKYVVVQADGLLVEKSAVDLLTSDVILAYYAYYGGPGFETNIDARWTFNGTTASFEVTAAPASYKGADFTSLQEACDFVAAVTPTKPEGRWTIRVIGELELSDTLDLTGYGSLLHVTIKGDNPRTSVIKTTTSFAAAKHLIHVNSSSLTSDMNHVDFENINFQWKSTIAQGSGYAAIYNPGFYTVVRNCLFTGYPTGFQNAISYPPTCVASPEGLHLVDCYFNYIKGSIVDTNNLAKRVVVENCRAEMCQSLDFAFKLRTVGNKILRTTILGDAVDYFAKGVDIGHLGEIGGCSIYCRTGAAVQLSDPNTGTLKVDVYNNYINPIGGYGLSIYNSTGQDCQISFYNNTVEGGITAVDCENTSLHTGTIFIHNNRFDGQTGATIEGRDYMKEIRIERNFFVHQHGTPIHLVQNYNAWICGNRISGYGTSSSDCALKLEGAWANARATVTNNHFGAVGAHAASKVFYCGIARITCVGNTFEGWNGTGYIQTQIHAIVEHNGGRFIGNEFDDVGTYSMRFIQSAADDQGFICIEANRFNGVQSGGAMISIKGLSNTTINGNNFGSGLEVLGCAIELRKDGGWKCASTSITGNNFYKIQGIGDADYAVINNNDSANVNTTITGNNFRQCGYAHTSGVEQYIIKSSGQAVINSNNFYDCRGPHDAGGELLLICAASGYSTINSNVVYQNVGAADFTYGTYYGIYAQGENCVINDNLFHVTGTTVSPIPNITCIVGAASKQTVVGNRFTSWTNGVSPSSVNRTIDLFGSTEKHIVIGNGADKYDIEASAAPSTNGLVLGNICWGGGVQTGGNHAANNYQYP